MKTFGLLFLFFFSASAYSQGKINWMSWEDAVQKSKTDSIPKKVFIDFYTGWCGWCKRMDQTTFLDQNVVAIMNANYYPVKFDAEMMDTISFNGTDFFSSDPKYKKTSANARGKVHMLAYAMLDGVLSYPSYAILDEKFIRLTIYKGFMQPNPLLGTLLFFSTNQHQQYNNYLYSQWDKMSKQNK